MIYICTVCQAEFDYRCPDGPGCNLNHPCTYCNNEVVVRPDFLPVTDNNNSSTTIQTELENGNVINDSHTHERD